MQDLQKKLGMAIIMVTHDLGVIASMCDEIIVMYGEAVSVSGAQRMPFSIIRRMSTPKDCSAPSQRQTI